MIYVGNKNKENKFNDIDRCKYFAEHINSQPRIPPKREKYIAVCEIKQVNPGKTKVYR